MDGYEHTSKNLIKSIDNVNAVVITIPRDIANKLSKQLLNFIKISNKDDLYYGRINNHAKVIISLQEATSNSLT